MKSFASYKDFATRTFTICEASDALGIDVDEAIGMGVARGFHLTPRLALQLAINHDLHTHASTYTFSGWQFPMALCESVRAVLIGHGFIDYSSTFPSE